MTLKPRTRTVLFWLAIIGGAVLVGLAVGPPPNGGPPFDPRSTSGDGTKALPSATPFTASASERHHGKNF